MHVVTKCMSGAAKNRCGTEPERIMHSMMNAALRQTYKVVPDCSPTTTPTSDSSTISYGNAPYLTFVVSCIIVLVV